MEIDEDHVKTIFYNVLCAVNFIHSANIMHRDIKDSNILIAEDCTIKICDFGWSAEAKSNHQFRTTFCGTVDYMAPEMLNNKPYNSSLDIWCLGILLYEL